MHVGWKHTMRDEWKKHDEQDRRAQSATPAQHPFERQEDDSVGQRGCCDLDALQDLHAVAEEKTRKIAHRKGEVAIVAARYGLAGEASRLEIGPLA